MAGQNNNGIHIICEDGSTIFNSESKYVIPLYQRAFAWKETQLVQLLEDISDISEKDEKVYYLGTLIVAKKDEMFEVIDGQQRLTALFLLLSILDQQIEKNALTFACRDKSNYTLGNIQKFLRDDWSGLDADRIESGIEEGLEILRDELKRDELKKYNKDDLLKKLRRVVLFRVEVPENTDLNRYFEIMNTRGEQLEQHDILKATLMGYLSDNQDNPDDLDNAIFAKIWDACSDMTGYVQMHFPLKVRENLFGSGWAQMPPGEWDDMKARIESGKKTDGGDEESSEESSKKIDEIIAKPPVSTVDGENEDGDRVRFESVIDFPYFLLHTLNVLIEIKGIRHEDGVSPIIAGLLDDKKLVDSFDRVIKFGITDTGRIAADEKQFSKDFIICLLRTRCLFDKYIIKREYLLKDVNSDGEWSLKTLRVSDKKPYYTNTAFIKKGEWDQEDKSKIRSKENIMIQSALRVSYTSPKVMHWIKDLLICLTREIDKEHPALYTFSDEAEKIAKESVRKNFFVKCSNNVFDLGVNTPHIVLNYLDYLLWKKDKNKYSDFVFEFRNSVEHWYPQHPVSAELSPWGQDDEGGVDRFGNLCLIQRQLNSKFSNLDPEAKKDQYVNLIDKGSIKLRIMREKTVTVNGIRGSNIWKKEECKKHEDEMICILKTACNESDRLTDAAE